MVDGVQMLLEAHGVPKRFEADFAGVGGRTKRMMDVEVKLQTAVRIADEAAATAREPKGLLLLLLLLLHSRLHGEIFENALIFRILLVEQLQSSLFYFCRLLLRECQSLV